LNFQKIYFPGFFIKTGFEIVELNLKIQ